MLRMVSYSRRPQSGQITCYLNRTYHVLLTIGAAFTRLSSTDTVAYAARLALAPSAQGVAAVWRLQSEVRHDHFVSPTTRKQSDKSGWLPAHDRRASLSAWKTTASGLRNQLDKETSST